MVAIGTILIPAMEKQGYPRKRFGVGAIGDGGRAGHPHPALHRDGDLFGDSTNTSVSASCSSPASSQVRPAGDAARMGVTWLVAKAPRLSAHAARSARKEGLGLRSARAIWGLAADTGHRHRRHLFGGVFTPDRSGGDERPSTRFLSPCLSTRTSGCQARAARCCSPRPTMSGDAALHHHQRHPVLLFAHLARTSRSRWRNWITSTRNFRSWMSFLLGGQRILLAHRRQLHGTDLHRAAASRPSCSRWR